MADDWGERTLVHHRADPDIRYTLDLEDEPANSGSSTPALAAAPPRPVARTRWADEDKEEEQVIPFVAFLDRWLTRHQDDWDASEDEKPKAAPTGTAAPTKKKMTLTQKLAEKERLGAEEVKRDTA